MSSYVLDDKEISGLVNWARINGVSYRNRVGHWIDVKERPAKIAQTLLDENVKSVNHRYNETGKQKINYTRFRIDSYSLAQIAKLCHCYEYQSCEHDGFESSVASNIIKAIKEKILTLIPGYDDAFWGLN